MTRVHLIPAALLALGLIGCDSASPPCDLEAVGVICTIAGNGENGYDRDADTKAIPALEAKMSLPQDTLTAPDGTLNPAGARPEGSIELTDVPTALASLGGKDLADLITQALGQSVSARLTADQNADTTSINVGVNASSGTTLATSATLAPNELSVASTTARASVSPSLLRALTKHNPSVPTLASPATVDLTLEPVAIPLKNAAIDTARLASRRIKANIVTNADIADVVIASSTPGAAPMRTGW